MIDTSPRNARPAPDRDWWRGAVIYQIYPRSFQDSNSDGIGDLAGIIQRLPHIASMGVDAIWISPFCRSPMKDFGYDVSDYRDIDPMFGTIGDFDALIEESHRLGIRVLMDLVISHTSAEHVWFNESRTSRDNPKSDWYVWADPKPDGSPPNNWLSIFGGPAWEWDAERMQYYLHNFLTEQPDLNLHNPEVQDELLEIVRFWLHRGVDGFRLDTINFYFHDQQLRDNPALARERINDTIAPAVNPYNWQEHLYDKNRPENLAFLKRLRAVMDEFPDTALVGEVGDAQYGMEIQAQYTAGDDMVHMCYDFAFLSGAYPTAERVFDILTRFEQINVDGWACWAYSNHDVMRHATRWGLSEAGCRVYAALLMAIRGSVCIYQGEELGLPEAYVAFEDLQDPYGKRFWPKFRGRDGCRTPMPWTPDMAHGGFSDAKPWLPLPAEHLAHTVVRQEAQPDSLMQFYRAAIAFRKAHAALRKGSLEIVLQKGDMLGFVRRHQGREILCLFNLGDKVAAVAPPGDGWVPCPDSPYPGADPAGLPPFSAYFGMKPVG